MKVFTHYEYKIDIKENQTNKNEEAIVHVYLL